MNGKDVIQINSLQGIIRALEEYRKHLLEHKVTIHVRRGGPNYQEGLRKMKETGLFHHLSYHISFHLLILSFSLSNDFAPCQKLNVYFLGSRLNLPIHVYGPETHMTGIVAAALGLRHAPDKPLTLQAADQFLLQPEADVSMDK